MKEPGGLGRIFEHDPLDGAYPLRVAIAAAVPPTEPVRRLPDKVWGFRHPPLNQGKEGTCVGHGWEHFLVAAPVQKRHPDAPPTALDIYRGACALDQYADNDDGNPEAGTTVRAGAKWLQSQGIITGDYRWAETADQVADWIAGLTPKGRPFGGAVVIGVHWYAGMDHPEADGLVHPTGSVRGGHCVALIGYHQGQGLFLGLNSWGPDWGVDGRFWLSGEDLDRLLREQGEACAATQTRLPAGRA